LRHPLAGNSGLDVCHVAYAGGIPPRIHLPPALINEGPEPRSGTTACRWSKAIKQASGGSLAEPSSVPRRQRLQGVGARFTCQSHEVRLAADVGRKEPGVDDLVTQIKGDVDTTASAIRCNTRQDREEATP
jgi:hypothetical protein